MSAARCGWVMPADAAFCAGARCVRDEHEGSPGHVIAQIAGDSIKLWRVRPDSRTAEVVTIADGRDGRARTDEDAAELWRMLDAGP